MGGDLKTTPLTAKMEVLPLRLGNKPSGLERKLMRMTKEERWARVQDPHEGTAVDGSKERRAITRSGISSRDVSPVYFSPDPYHSSFEERLDMR